MTPKNRRNVFLKPEMANNDGGVKQRFIEMRFGRYKLSLVVEEKDKNGEEGNMV